MVAIHIKLDNLQKHMQNQVECFDAGLLGHERDGWALQWKPLENCPNENLEQNEIVSSTAVNVLVVGLEV